MGYLAREIIARRKISLANNDFVGAQQAQNRACLLIEQVQIKIVVRQAAGQVLHRRDIGFQSVQIMCQRVGLGGDFDAAEQAKITLHGGKGEIGAQGKGQGEIDERTKTGSGAADHGMYCLLNAPLAGVWNQYGTGDSRCESPRGQKFVGRQDCSEMAFAVQTPCLRRGYLWKEENCQDVARAATPGKVLPSIHSRKAPPAVEI